MIGALTYRGLATGDPRGTVGKSVTQGAGARVRQMPVRLGAALALLASIAVATPLHAQGPAATGVGSQFELTYWQSVESGNDAALYEAYLAQYPNGTFAPVARVKLAKLRQTASATSPTSAPTAAPATAPIQPAPPQAIALAPAPAPVPAAAVQPAIAVAPPVSAPARRQLASARVAAAPGPAVRERIAPRASSESAPYVTAAPPTEPAGDTEDSAALHRLLGALGDSQRAGVPPPASILEAPDAPASDSAPLAATTAPAMAPQTAPAAVSPRLVETAAPIAPRAVMAPAGPPIAVPDAAALSALAPAADPHPIAVGPLPSGFALPPRPQLAAIPPLAFPASFCSAEERNAFHDGPYIAAVDASKHNNDAAIAYLHQLQDLYDTNQLSGDINPVNAIAAESRAYGPVAAAAFSAQSTLVNAFSTLMAVPITGCDTPKQP